MRTDGYIVPAELREAFQTVRKRKSYIWSLPFGVYGDMLISGISESLFDGWMSKASGIQEAWHKAAK